MVADVEARVEECVTRVMASELATVASMFRHVYATPAGAPALIDTPVVLARLGDTVDEVVIVEWLVAVGAEVQPGDPLVRVETDKVEVDVESPYAGTVSALSVAEGDEVPTGATLCHDRDDRMTGPLSRHP